MAKLSISKAWDETRETLKRDGGLLVTIALALMVLPGIVRELVTPAAPAGQLPKVGYWVIVAVIALIIALAGQLAVIRLAIGSRLTVGEAIGHGLAYATEDRKRYGLNLIEDIKRNVSAAALGKLARRGWVDDNKEYQVADGFRESMNIKAPSVLSVTGKLSGGNQQKVVLSKWIFTDADVLILDEPTRGIDVGAKYEIYTIINALAAQGKAVIVISSELPELLGLSDRIYTLFEGQITGVLDKADANQESLMKLMTKARTTASAAS